MLDEFKDISSIKNADETVTPVSSPLMAGEIHSRGVSLEVSICILTEVERLYMSARQSV